MVPKFLIFTDSCLVLFGSHISPGFFHSRRIPVSHGSGFTLKNISQVSSRVEGRRDIFINKNCHFVYLMRGVYIAKRISRIYHIIHQPSFIGIPISFGGIPKAGPGHLADTC